MGPLGGAGLHFFSHQPDTHQLTLRDHIYGASTLHGGPVPVCFPAFFGIHCTYPWTDGLVEGDHLCGKPGNVRYFDSCHRNARDFTKSRKCQGKNLVREKWPKTVYC